MTRCDFSFFLPTWFKLTWLSNGFNDAVVYEVTLIRAVEPPLCLLQSEHLNKRLMSTNNISSVTATLSHLALVPHAHMNALVYVPLCTADTWLPVIAKSLVAARNVSRAAEVARMCNLSGGCDGTRWHLTAALHHGAPQRPVTLVTE